MDRTRGARLCATLAEAADGALNVVDMPIGLADAKRPRRAVDAEARALLGPRRSSVFTPPCREALAAPDYPGANTAQRAATGQGLAKQAYYLGPKMREADALARALGQDRLREGHPELAFLSLIGAPMPAYKKTPEGAAARRDALRAAGLDPDALPRPDAKGWAADDLLDACALLLVAERIARGEGRRVPDAPLEDAAGLRAEIWF